MANFKFDISLRELRKKNGFSQKDVKKYTQTSVSKIESRSDLKLSTLMKYLDAIGIDVEIRAVAQKPHSEPGESFELLNTVLKEKSKKKLNKTTTLGEV